MVPDRWPEPGANLTRAVPLSIHEVPVRNGGSVNAWRMGRSGRAELSALLARTRPDLIDVAEEPFSWAVHEVVGLAGRTPIVCYAAQNLSKTYPPPFSRWQRQAFGRLSGVYACSRQSAAVVRRKGCRTLVRVVPLGFDPAVFHPDGRPVAAGASTGLTLGYVGRLVDRKGATDAVRVLARLRARGMEVELLVVGDGPQRSALDELASSLNVGAHVRCLGWRHGRDLADAYRSMDCLLVPSRTLAVWAEQFGRVLVESQACATPVAAYATGTIPAVAGPAALLAHEADWVGLADLLESSFREQRLGTLGRWGQRWADSYRWDSVARQHEAFYREALEGASEVDPGSDDAGDVGFGPTAAVSNWKPRMGGMRLTSFLASFRWPKPSGHQGRSSP